MKKIHKTKLMAILNVTPDSFYTSSRAANLEQAIDMAQRFASEGADILDIGGESSRPGAIPVSEEEELARVIPLITALKNAIQIPISIDTVTPSVARAAALAGATLLNDISGFSNPAMVDVAIEYDMDMCVMHMLGTPETMQNNPLYEEGVVAFLMKWFEERIEQLLKQGVDPHCIILDPGIGFGKTVADNLEILHNLPKLKTLGFPVLFGASRKSFLSKILSKPTNELLPATLGVNAIAVKAGTDVIRVHDVREHRDLIDVLHACVI
jgi:dihydropteroate synthase